MGQRLPKVDAVVIGRNEATRLGECLASLAPQVRRIVYVDSGSTDGSLELARSLRVEVIELDLSRPFTAARARNAGLYHLAQDPPQFVQFVDGDCLVHPDWIADALTAMKAHPRAVVVCGRRYESFPDQSIYNRMIDKEWDTPIGQSLACGGDSLMRYAEVRAVAGFREDLIAGEEPELCLRLRARGGEIWRIDAEMTQHDAAIRRFSQFWRRSQRSGFAYAEARRLHGTNPEFYWKTHERRALTWGLALPTLILAAALVWPKALWALMVYPAQVLRLSRRKGWEWAGLTLIGKFAEAQGALQYHFGRLRGKRRGLIEYK